MAFDPIAGKAAGDLVVYIAADTTDFDYAAKKFVYDLKQMNNEARAIGADTAAQMNETAKIFSQHDAEVNKGIQQGIKETEQEYYDYYNELERKMRQEDKNQNKLFNDYYNGMERDIKETQRFRGEWMSLMFLGMGISSVFGGYISQMMKMFGVTDLLSIVMQSFLIPVFKALMPLIVGIFKFFMNLPEGIKGVIGMFMVIITVVGILMAVIFALGLGLAGLGVVLSASSIGAAIGIAIAGFTVLAGVALILWAALDSIVEVMTRVLDKMSSMKQPFNQALGESLMESALGMSSARSYQTSNSVNVNANVASNLDTDLLGRKIYEQLQPLQAGALA